MAEWSVGGREAKVLRRDYGGWVSTFYFYFRGFWCLVFGSREVIEKGVFGDRVVLYLFQGALGFVGDVGEEAGIDKITEENNVVFETGDNCGSRVLWRTGYTIRDVC